MHKHFPSLTSRLYKNRFLLGVLLSAILIMIVPFPAFAGSSTGRVFRVEASRFSYSPATLYVNPGDTVTIELVAKDVVHGLMIDGYGIGITGDPGQTARLSFIADRKGSFRFRCSVTCGNMHPFMIGKLQVGQNLLFWRGAALTILIAVGISLRGRQ